MIPIRVVFLGDCVHKPMTQASATIWSHFFFFRSLMGANLSVDPAIWSANLHFSKNKNVFLFQRGAHLSVSLSFIFAWILALHVHLLWSSDVQKTVWLCIRLPYWCDQMHKENWGPELMSRPTNLRKQTKIQCVYSDVKVFQAELLSFLHFFLFWVTENAYHQTYKEITQKFDAIIHFCLKLFFGIFYDSNIVNNMCF